MQCNCSRIIKSFRGQSTVIRLRGVNFSAVRRDTKYNELGARYLYIQTDQSSLHLIETCRFRFADPVWLEQFRGIADRPVSRRLQRSSAPGRPRPVLGSCATVATFLSGTATQLPGDLLRTLQHAVQDGRRVFQRVVPSSAGPGSPLRIVPAAPVYE